MNQEMVLDEQLDAWRRKLADHEAALRDAGAAPAGYRPYRAPKPNAVTVAKPDRASDGGAVDAELAAAGWRPYRDPRSKA
jgi:hypothetical protein